VAGVSASSRLLPASNQGLSVHLQQMFEVAQPDQFAGQTKET
jgi:hypothetical protein